MIEQLKNFAVLISFMLLVLAILLLCEVMVNGQTNMGPIRTPQINTTLYVGQSGYPTIQRAVTFACGNGSQSFAVMILPGTVPSDSPTSVTGGCVGTYIADLRVLPHRYYTWSGTAYTLSSTVPGMTFTSSGLPDLAQGSQLANSPICTEATGCPNTAGTYPPAGIGVSTGTAWSPNSINPASLATWPAAGIPLSTGTSWNGSINPADIPRLSAALNAFTGSVSYVNGITLPDGTDLNTLNSANAVYFITNGALNAPPIFGGDTRGIALQTITPILGVTLQIAWGLNDITASVYERQYRTGGWEQWHNLRQGNAYTLPDGTNLDLINASGGLFYIDSAAVNPPPVPGGDTRSLMVQVNVASPNFFAQQFAWGNNDASGATYSRVMRAGVWGPWQELQPLSLIATPVQPLHSQSRCDPNSPMWHDANYIYVCTAQNQVKRVSLSAF
jgi:hypothetical protein